MNPGLIQIDIKAHAIRFWICIDKHMYFRGEFGFVCEPVEVAVPTDAAFAELLPPTVETRLPVKWLIRQSGASLGEASTQGAVCHRVWPDLSPTHGLMAVECADRWLKVQSREFANHRKPPAEHVTKCIPYVFVLFSFWHLRDSDHRRVGYEIPIKHDRCTNDELVGGGPDDSASVFKNLRTVEFWNPHTTVAPNVCDHAQTFRTVLNR